MCLNVKNKSPEPPRTVVWYRNGKNVNTLLKRGGISVVTESRRRTSNLLISKVTTKDAGNYTCAPSNAQADSVMVHVIEGMFGMNRSISLRHNFSWYQLKLISSSITHLLPFTNSLTACFMFSSLKKEHKMLPYLFALQRKNADIN